MDIQVDLMERQHALEQEMAGLGEASFWRGVAKAKERAEEGNTSYGHLILRHAVIPVEAAIVKFIAEAKSGRPGRRGKAFKYLEQVEPRLAAFIVARTVIDSLTLPVPLQRVALRIAQGLEDEVRFRKFDKEMKGLFRLVRDEVVKRTSSGQWQRKVIIHSMNKAQVHWQSWPEVDRLHLGQKCLDLFIEATGMVKVEVFKTGRNHSKATIQPTQETLDLITKMNAKSSLLSPHYMPTIVPPKDWTNPYDGGYHFRPATIPFVKTSNRNYLEELRNRTSEMPEVYEAVNALQRTAWKINSKVLEVVRAIYDTGVPVAGLPPRDNEPLPAKPVDIAENADSRKVWKIAASKVHEDNTKLVSKRLQTMKVIWLAEKFAPEPAIYFPQQMDFRGRVYSLPMFLNPQGADVAKGLLTFAHGKPIDDVRGAGWLMVQGANTFGIDKVSMEQRVAWVEENTARILAVSADPTNELWWTEAESSFQFLAFCFEYAEFLKHGYGFVSCLPVALDGTCNGLQHFSAMLRDEVGGRAVNMLPAEKPDDIYQRVADKVIGKLTPMNELLASQWITFGITRKLTKRPVMVLPYGGTIFSCRQYVIDYIEEQRREGKPVPWEKESTWGAAAFLARIIWDSIGEVVIAARSAMDWLQRAATIAAQEGLPIHWRTPDGFPVLQAYPEYKHRRVSTILGKRVQLVLVEATPTLDKKRQANGISPNFVHSQDACAMRRYVVMAGVNGVTSFGTVHDSYATLAADTDVSMACLRHAFVDMYTENDALGNLRASLMEMLPPETELPPLPALGTLDLELVREAQYFFA